MSDIIPKIPRPAHFLQPTPRDNTPREIARYKLATKLVDGEWVKFADVEDPDNDSWFQGWLDHLFKLQEDCEEYEAKYGPVMGVPREQKLREIMEKDRVKYAKRYAAYEDKEEAEKDLEFFAGIELNLIEIEAQLEAQRVIKIERGEEVRR